MDEVKERRARREGKVTPKALVAQLLQAIERGEIQAVVFVAKQHDGVVKTGWSDSRNLELIGMLECGKNDLLVDMLG